MATTTTNYALTKPATSDYYDIAIPNANMDLIDGELEKRQQRTNLLTESTGPDAADFIPIYDTSASAHRKLTLTTLGFWLKAVFDAAYATLTHTHTVSALTDFAAGVRAVVLTGVSTATDASIIATDSVLAALGKLQAQLTAHRTNTNNPHGTTPAQIGAAPSVHSHAASDVGAGTFANQVVANAAAVATLGTAQVRNLYAGTVDLTAGVTSLLTGDMYALYE